MDFNHPLWFSLPYFASLPYLYALLASTVLSGFIAAILLASKDKKARNFVNLSFMMSLVILTAGLGFMVSKSVGIAEQEDAITAYLQKEYQLRTESIERMDMKSFEVLALDSKGDDVKASVVWLDGNEGNVPAGHEAVRVTLNTD